MFPRSSISIMKRFILALAALTLLILPSCHKEPKASKEAISIKVIVPEETASSDAIYIAGPFTGGEGFSVGNPAWKLQRSGVNCSITLEPDTFIGNYTLADGFWFVSEQQGAELDADGKAVMRTLSGKEGSYVVAKWSR